MRPIGDKSGGKHQDGLKEQSDIISRHLEAHCFESFHSLQSYCSIHHRHHDLEGFDSTAHLFHIKNNALS